MKAVPLFEKLRKVRTEEEEDEVQQELYFQLPRKTGIQIAPHVERIKAMKKTEQHLALRLLRKIMKRACVPKLTQVVGTLLEMDKSESIVPHGEVSKKIYNDIQHSREFNLYGTNIPTKDHVPYDERREKELRNKAVELGIEFVSMHGGTTEGVYGNKKDRNGVPDIFSDNVSDLKRPVISTATWAVGYEEMKDAPIGTAKDPGPIYRSEGNEKYFAYDGEWSKGKMKGDGKYQYADGETYVGKFENNWPQGMGTATYSNGGKYEGEWHKGRYHTTRAVTKKEEVDATLMGTFQEGAEMHTCVGSHYKGDFQHGRRDGHGVLTLPCGLTYEGYFLDGKPHGRGVIRSALSSYSFEGQFVRGSVFGIGTLITPRKERIVRLWEHKDPDLKDEPLTLTSCIKMYLQDIQDKKDEESARSNQLYALRRGLQLRHYVHTIRTELHEERARKKFERQNEIIRLMKEQKRKLHEARVNALIGAPTEDDV